MSEHKWKGMSLKDRWKDPEWRAYMTEVGKRSPGTKGTTRTEESKARTRKSISDYWESEQGVADKRRNGSMKGIGAGHSPNSGSFKPGFVPWNKGKHYTRKSSITAASSDSTKALRSRKLKEYYQTEAGIARRKEIAANASKHHKGTTRTKEHRQAISKSVAKVYQEQEFHPQYWTKRGHHDSPKSGKVYYRSSYELEVYKQLDAITDVVSYKAEAVSIPYEWNGITRIYLPDLLVCLIDGTELVIEIKPNYQLDDPQNQAKFLAAQAIYGDRFEVWSEELIFSID